MEDPTPKKARAKRATPPPAPKARTTARPQAEPRPRKAAAKAVKAAPAKKAAPRRAQPVLDEALLNHLDEVLADLDPAVLGGPSPQPTPRPEPTAPHGNQRTAPLWARLVADPGYAPEHVIRELVRLTGPQAQDWVDRMRVRYPDARPDALARLAASELTREGRRRGAAAAAAGLVGAMACVGVVARVQVRLALTVAAAYGLDPTSEDRTRDVADLLRVPRLTQPTVAAVANAGRLAVSVAGVRVAARLLPFGAVVSGAVHGGRTTADLATRAISRFRPGPRKRELEEPDSVA